jgi:hypothetical protein
LTPKIFDVVNCIQYQNPDPKFLHFERKPRRLSAWLFFVE